MSCFRQGRRAVIEAEVPADASAVELVTLYRRLAGSALSAAQTSPTVDQRPLPRLARGLAEPWRRRPKEEAKNPRRAAMLAALLAGEAAIGGLVPGATLLLPVGAALAYDATQMGKLRRRVCDELYAYGASRFLQDEFPTMVDAP